MKRLLLLGCIGLGVVSQAHSRDSPFHGWMEREEWRMVNNIGLYIQADERTWFGTLIARNQLSNFRADFETVLAQIKLSVTPERLAADLNSGETEDDVWRDAPMSVQARPRCPEPDGECQGIRMRQPY